MHAVVNVPQPTNVEQVRSFLGFVNYYHKFLPNLATILHPPESRLLEHGQKCIKWTEKCNEAFSKVKKLITSDMVLTHYDPNLRSVSIPCISSRTVQKGH